ncbi:MAG: ankyrin repeat domain-containing protein [Sphingobacteriia bacterium]|nr:ankyrin repeat domain-containing protein [Sphingobacteriia bacterium]
MSDLNKEFIISIEKNDIGKIKELISQNVELKSFKIDYQLKIPLFTAIRKGNLKVIKLLLDKGADINIQDDSGNTALHIAVYENNPGIMKFLLDRGANPYISNSDSAAPIHLAIDKNYQGKEFIEILCKKNFNLNIQNNCGFTPFSYALYHDKKGAMAVMVDYDINLNIQNVEGKTVLHFCRDMPASVIDLLLDLGGDLTIKDKYGNTPHHYIVNSYNFHAIDRFFENDSYINIQNDQGETPLNYFISNSHPSNTNILSFLLQKGADVNMPDIDGETPLFRATYLNKNKFEEILKENGAKMYEINKEFNMKNISVESYHFIKEEVAQGENYENENEYIFN